MPNFDFGQYVSQFFLQYVMSIYSLCYILHSPESARFFIFPTIDWSRQWWRYQQTHMLTSTMAQLVA